ncbi:MAG TPA: hypothetical protein DCW72_03575 [Elusimicrobia bacterium]|nr:MAG: hypothetical protein A2X29_08445 [Elusimicrobia bacterium GWA2_64_40]OGR65609.1 MAG: hypothetical protein A2X30_00870 [Elusimicrobia bacterium GWB2_63_16]HAN05411.1 hypothetical protein [Elusimicrobiota bacterium]HAU89329.1 hypothetical protein [Elusimicrobiota bacterium]
MKNLLFTAALLLGGAAYAQETPAQAAQPAPQPVRLDPALERTGRNLAILAEKYAEIPAERLQRLAPEMEKFNTALREALGEKILAEIAAREKAAEEKARVESAMKTLQAFRGALQVYYTQTGGKYPKSPAELAPDSISAVPELHLPGHERTSGIKIVDSRKFDKDISRAVTGSGGWLYFSNPDSTYYGLLLLDSANPGPDGMKFFEY